MRSVAPFFARQPGQPFMAITSDPAASSAQDKLLFSGHARQWYAIFQKWANHLEPGKRQRSLVIG
jgi:hypothetical protein